MAEIFCIAVDALVFQQTTEVTPLGGTPSNFLNLQQSATTQNKFVSAKNELVFQQVLTTNNILHVGINQYLSFEQRGARVHIVEVYQVIPFFQQATKDNIHHTLIFNQSATFTLSKATSNLLIFDGEATYNIVKNLIINQTILFEQESSVYTLNSSVILSPPVTIVEVFQVNFTRGSRSITLPSPQFGNTDSLTFNRINRKSRGGDLIVYRNLGLPWPKTAIFNLTWTNLKGYQLTDLLQFIKDTLGLSVTYTDFESRVWIGLISTPNGGGRQIGREKFGATLEFQLE